MQNTLRAFVAMILPADGIDVLADLQGGLKARGLKLRWVRPRNLHLTMKFLGDIQRADLPDVVEAVQQAVARHSPLNLTLQGMGVFPGIKRPRILWAGLGGDTQGLGELFSDVEAGLADIGFERDKRDFKAHVTLARIRKRVSPQRLLDAVEDVGRYAPYAFVARRMVLMKSDLQPGGAAYTTLTEAVLA